MVDAHLGGGALVSPDVAYIRHVKGPPEFSECPRRGGEGVERFAPFCRHSSAYKVLRSDAWSELRKRTGR